MFWNASDNSRRRGSRGMPEATPGVGECSICFEVVPCVKVLDCDHHLCLPCATKLVREAGHQALICCPQCRHETDCSHGLADLRTLYFGKVLCDYCLEKKDSSDMWWCRDCFKALCSKCSITEHQDKKHYLSEWNKQEAVQFSVNYINQVQYRRQMSTSSKNNKETVSEFLKDVETLLHSKLRLQPDIVNLKDNLLSRYGTRFSSSDTSSDAESTSTSTAVSNAPSLPPSSSAPKTVAKVLQLAGADIKDDLIPKISDQTYNITFSITAEDVAQLLRSKTEFIPVENTANVTTTQNSSSNAAGLSVDVEETEIGRIGGSPVVLQVDFCPESNVAVLRTAVEVQLYNFTTNKRNSVPSAAKMNVRDVCFGASGNELLMCQQSTEKQYAWQLEAFDFSNQPVSLAYSSPFDIDPEDRVEEMHLKVAGEPNSIYELRLCRGNVSEIWRGQIHTKKKGKVKLQEKLVYQRGQARYTSLSVLNTSKERFLFVWDDLSACLYRLIVRDGKCDLLTKVLHSPEVIPFCVDSLRQLVFYDAHAKTLCRSNGHVMNRVNVTFHAIAAPLNAARYTVRCVRVAGDNSNQVFCVAVTPTHVTRILFQDNSVATTATSNAV